MSSSRYFSLQATCPQGFSDTVRFLIEGNICQESGPPPSCFDLPLRVVLLILERVSVVYRVVYTSDFTFLIFLHFLVLLIHLTFLSFSFFLSSLSPVIYTAMVWLLFFSLLCYSFFPCLVIVFSLLCYSCFCYTSTNVSFPSRTSFRVTCPLACTSATWGN